MIFLVHYFHHQPNHDNQRNLVFDFQNGDYDTTGNGIVYFDTTGKQVGAAGTAAGISTSNFVLTTNASGIPKWTDTLDGGTF